MIGRTEGRLAICLALITGYVDACGLHAKVPKVIRMGAEPAVAG